MSVLYPTLALRRVTAITPQLLEELGVEALILDADNTLTTHNNPVPDRDVLKWLSGLRESGIKLIIASNNSEGRIRPFAELLDIRYLSRAMKPLPMGLRVAAKRMGLSAARVAVVGDQIFTDILGGNLLGAATILVEPMEPEAGPFFRLKRRVEAGILRRYRTKHRKGDTP